MFSAVIYCTFCVTMFSVRCKKIMFVNSYISSNCCGCKVALVRFVIELAQILVW